jgi:hypothetical protein
MQAAGTPAAGCECVPGRAARGKGRLGAVTRKTTPPARWRRLPAAERAADPFEGLVFAAVEVGFDVSERRVATSEQPQLPRGRVWLDGVHAIQCSNSVAIRFAAVAYQKVAGVPSTMRSAPVAARIFSTVVSDAISFRTRPRSVTSITASSVTIRFTTFIPVNGSVHRSSIL